MMKNISRLAHWGRGALALLLFLCLATSARAQTGIINTVAGSSSLSGDGGLATNVKLNSPQAVAVDSAGNLFIADYGNHVIRRVSTNGTISTVAGNGNYGYTGDGRLATNATLSNPEAVALDSVGNMFIADSGNQVIRRVDKATGNISTFARTSGAGIALDSTGNLFVANNQVINRVDKTTGVISTVAGNGNGNYSYTGDGGPATSASLNSPDAVTVDGAGNLFIADNGNSVIRRVDKSTGIINTVAGTGASGYSGDGGLATNATLYYPRAVTLDSAGNLFISDEGNQVIRRVDKNTGNISTVAGNGAAGYTGDGVPATSARLNNPVSVAVDSAGNLFIADYSNNVIRRVDSSTGIISTFAGYGNGNGDGHPATTAKLNFPEGVAVDSVGNLFIADYSNSAIRRVDKTTGTISTVASLYYPQVIAVDSAGNLFFFDTQNNVIRRLDKATGAISTVAGNGTRGYTGDGGLATSASFSSPQGLAFDSAGNLFIADYYNYVIRRVDKTSGIVSTVAGTGASGYTGDDGPATSAKLNNPSGIAVDSSGNLFIADYYKNVIRRVDGSTGIISTFAGNATQGYSGDGGPATSASLKIPEGITIDSAGNLFFDDYGNNVIRRVDKATGVISTFAGNGIQGYTGDGGPATTARLYNPQGIAVDSVGNLFIADTQNNAIRRVNGAGATPTPTPTATATATATPTATPNPNTSVWRASDLSVGSDNLARLLWKRPDTAFSLWTLGADNGISSSPIYQPIPSWNPGANPVSSWSGSAIGLDNNNQPRLLLNNPNGQSAVWNFSSLASFSSTPAYGAYDGWTCREVAAGGSDGTTRLLWTRSDGAFSVWTVASDNSFVSTPVYGPYNGWSARAISVGGDGRTRILFTNTSGQIGVWTINSDGNYAYTPAYGPYDGWSCVDIAVGADNQTRLLWTRSDGAFSMWTIHADNSVAYSPVYGSIPFWSASKLAISNTGGDGLVRLFLSRTTGEAAVWTLGADGSHASTPAYGPFAAPAVQSSSARLSAHAESSKGRELFASIRKSALDAGAISQQRGTMSVVAAPTSSGATLWLNVSGTYSAQMAQPCHFTVLVNNRRVAVQHVELLSHHVVLRLPASSLKAGDVVQVWFDLLNEKGKGTCGGVGPFRAQGATASAPNS